MAFICDTAMNTTHLCNVCMWWFLTLVGIFENLISKQIYNCAFFDLVPRISAKHICSLLLNQPLHKNADNMRWQVYGIIAEFNSSYSSTIKNNLKKFIFIPGVMKFILPVLVFCLNLPCVSLCLCLTGKPAEKPGWDQSPECVIVIAGFEYHFNIINFLFPKWV